MNDLIDNLLRIQELQFVQGEKVEKNPALSGLRQKIPVQILNHLDRLLERGKKAVALVVNSTCCECHMRVPVGTVATLKRGDDIQICGSCGRYLCLAKVESAPSPAPKPERRPRGRKKKDESEVHAR